MTERFLAYLNGCCLLWSLFSHMSWHPGCDWLFPFGYFPSSLAPQSSPEQSARSLIYDRHFRIKRLMDLNALLFCARMMSEGRICYPFTLLLFLDDCWFCTWMRWLPLPFNGWWQSVVNLCTLFWMIDGCILTFILMKFLCGFVYRVSIHSAILPHVFTPLDCGFISVS